jgi:hypothetical protein
MVQQVVSSTTQRAEEDPAVQGLDRLKELVLGIVAEHVTVRRVDVDNEAPSGGHPRKHGGRPARIRIPAQPCDGTDRVGRGYEMSCEVASRMVSVFMFILIHLPNRTFCQISLNFSLSARNLPLGSELTAVGRKTG